MKQHILVVDCHGALAMPPESMPPALLAMVADRFKAFAEPVRLQILYALKAGEHTVTELVEATGLGQANLSRHLQVLLAAGLVERRKEGLFAYYAIANKDVFKLCDIVCGGIERDVDAKGKALRGR